MAARSPEQPADSDPWAAAQSLVANGLSGQPKTNVKVNQAQQFLKEKVELEENLRILREANQHLNDKVGALEKEKSQMAADKDRALSKLQFLTGESDEPEEVVTEYDLVCNLRSLSETVETGRIELWRASHSSFNVLEDRRCRIVAVLGLFDKGKTFLINKLFGVNLKSGKLFATSGFSFIWFERQRILILDTAGVQAPVSCRSNAVQAQGVQPMFDAHSTESLVFEVIPRLAHHVIFVVNDLTWGEQDYISKLNHKFCTTDRRRELIVVHNLRSTRAVEEAETLFTRQIAQLYDGERSHLASLVFTSDHGTSLPSVHHVGLCDDSSVAGERYNGPNIKVLMDMLEHRESLGTNVNLSVNIQNELQRLLPLFLNVEPTIGSADSPQLSVVFEPTGKDDVKLSCTSGVQDGVPRASGYHSVGDFVIRTKQPEQHISLRTRGMNGRNGVREHDHSFTPQINIFDQPMGSGEERRVIQIECPGVRTENVTITARPNGVKIAIEKKPSIDETHVKAVEDIRQHYGVFEKEFLFEQESGRFDICEEFGWYLEAGILTVVLRQERDRTVNMAARRPPVVVDEDA